MQLSTHPLTPAFDLELQDVDLGGNSNKIEI